MTTLNTPITVVKLDYEGVERLRYEGHVLARDETWVQVEAPFSLTEVPVADGIVFRAGDRFIEWHYNDRWYNIFEVHDSDDRLKCWYCNIARPAVLRPDEVSAVDLELDLLVWPDGRQMLLDEIEYAALPLEDMERRQTENALDQLRSLVETRTSPFDKITEG